MRAKFFFIAVAIMFFSVAAYSQNLEPKTLLTMKRIGDVQLSPDGKHFLFTITVPDMAGNSSTTQLYLMPSGGGEPQQLTRTGDHNYNGRWSPKADKIAFISDRNGKPQVFIMPLDGGDPKQITEMENGVEYLSWSPDGKHLAFVSDVKLDQDLHEKNPDLPDVKAYIYDNLPVRHWDEWLDEKWRHLFIMPAEGGEPRDVMPREKYDTPMKPFGGHEQIAWSPNGTEIAYTCKKVKDFATSTNSDIYVAPTYGGSSKNITQDLPGFDMYPVYSPNGRYIAFHSQDRPGYESDKVRVMLHTRSSGRNTDITENLDQWAGRMAWDSKSANVYVSAGNNDGTSQIWEISRRGKAKAITEGTYNFGTRYLQASPDGKTIYFSRENYNHPFEIFSMPAKGGSPKQLTNINKDVFSGIKPAKIEARWIQSTDTAKVHCWIVYPPDFDPNKKYPMITYCQGGPQQAVSQYWSYGWNFLTMASQGYIILAPNRRGCPGFGQAWVDAIKEDYGGKPMQDILAATKVLAAEPYVDESRIAAIGGSAGGYAVFWLEGNHEGLFSAFISHCGMFNMVSKYGSTEELWFPNWDNGGPYWDPKNKSFYYKNSPHEYVLNWSTPILIITGQKDYRVPYTQSLEAFTAAQLMKVPSRLLVYPEENHWVLKPQAKMLWYREFFRFLDLYCKNK